MSHKSLVVTIVVLAIALTASVAPASVLNYYGVGLNDTVKIHASGTLADGKTVPAGQMRIGYEGIDYNAYCVDINHYAGTGSVTERSINSLNNGSMAAFLFETYSEDVSTGLKAAALQVALWEVLFETGQTFNAGSGYFKISHNADVLSAANVLLSSLPDTYASQWDLTVLHSNCKQDMLIGVNPTPEPATLVLLGLGGIGMLLRRRRK